MKYNKFASILLLLSCIFTSLIIGLIIKKKSIFEGARTMAWQRSAQRSQPQQSSQQSQQQSPQPSSQQSPPQSQQQSPQPSPQPSVLIAKLDKALKDALDAENKIKATKNPNPKDVTTAQNLRQILDQLQKDVKQAMKDAEVKTVNSFMQNPIQHIIGIKNSVNTILNSVETDSNKLLQIMNDIVSANEPNKLDIIKNIKTEAQRNNNLDSEKLVNIRLIVR
jgi:hypothetical protein